LARPTSTNLHALDGSRRDRLGLGPGSAPTRSPRRSLAISRPPPGIPGRPDGSWLSLWLIHPRPEPFTTGRAARICARHGRSWPPVNAGAQCWKACWGQPLASSNLASSATLTCANAPCRRRLGSWRIGIWLSLWPRHAPCPGRLTWSEAGSRLCRAAPVSRGVLGGDPQEFQIPHRPSLEPIACTRRWRLDGRVVTPGQAPGCGQGRHARMPDGSFCLPVAGSPTLRPSSAWNMCRRPGLAASSNRRA
jgi:hypothetical protein